MKTPIQLFQNGGGILAAITISAGIFVPVMPARATVIWSKDASSVDGSGLFGSPSIALDSGGNILECSVYQDIVVKYNSSGSVVWTCSMGQYMNPSGRLVVDSGNNTYVNGTAPNTGASYLSVVKISPSGTVLWTNVFNIGVVSEHMGGGPMVLGNNGSLYVVGVAGNQSQSTAPVTILRINTSNGMEQNRVSPPATTGSGPAMPNSAIAADNNNNVFYGGPEGAFSYSASLASRWSNQAKLVRAIICDKVDNNVYVTGPYTASKTSGSYQMYVSRLNNGNGTATWATYFPGQTISTPYPGGDPTVNCEYGGNALAIDSNGNVYAVGCAQDSTGYVGGIVAQYNPNNGTLQWSQETTWSDWDGASISVAIDGSNNIYAAGRQAYGFGIGDATLNVFTSGGKAIWNDSFNSPAGLDDMFMGIVLASQGNVYGVTSSFESNGIHPIIVKQHQ